MVCNSTYNKHIHSDESHAHPHRHDNGHLTHNHEKEVASDQ